MPEDNQLYDPHEHEAMPEGEEQAPPYTHTMAIVRWALLIGMTLFAAIMVLHYFGATPWQSASAEATLYHCPMHPTYISNQPGECPICGMNLVPIDKEGHETTVKKDTAGTAGMPGMAAPTATMAKPGQYTCPMDPEIVSDKPGKCPICGMNLELVPLEPATGETNQVPPSTSMAMPNPNPVPGLVSVTIEPQRLQLIGVKTGPVQMRQIESDIRLVGYITPDETKVSNLSVRVNGWVQRLFVNQTGQLVPKGETLLSLYSQDLYQAQQDYLVALAATGQSTGDTTLDAARRQIVDAARERLRLLGVPDDDVATLVSDGKAGTDLTLRSQFAGVVLDKNVNQGQYVSPGQNLFTIADLRKVWVLADVYEKDMSQIKVGQNVTVTVSGVDEEFPGTVQLIYPTVSEQTRTAKLRIELQNPDMKLRPGMYADVRLVGDGKPVLAIPVEALMDGGETQYAFVVHDGTHFEPRLLKIGRRSDNWVEVHSGLAAGEVVVTSANFLIDSESRLKAAITGMGSAPTDSSTGKAGMPGMPGM